VAKKQPKAESFDEFLTRQYGDGVVTTASAVIDRPRKVLPTVLSLDIALNGGIPEGKIVLMSGRPKAGKTYLCLKILHNAIADGRHAFYFNIECRCGEQQVQQVLGDDSKHLRWIESTDETILTAEDWLNILERAIKDHPGAVIVVDSLAQLSTLVEQSEDLGYKEMTGGPAKLLSSFFRRMQSVIDTNNVILIFISQLITNRDPRGKKWIEKGGVAVQYSSSVWINAHWFKLWQPRTDNGEIDGQDVNFRIMASALGKPYMPCTVPVRFGVGVDCMRDLVINAENLGLVTKAGAWYSIPTFGEEKYQGVQNLIAHLAENPEKADKLEAKVREVVLPDASETEKRPEGKDKSDGK
jgi:recombination protein RecA